MSSSHEQRARRAGVVLLVVLQLGAVAVLAGAAIWDRTVPVAARPVADLYGTLDHFVDGGFTVGNFVALAAVRVDAATMLDAPATWTDLRPGCSILVWGPRTPDGTLIARRLRVGAPP